MQAKRFCEEQIIAVLREAEAGAKTKELPTVWGLGGDVLQLEGQVRRDDGVEARRLKELEAENSKLKRLVAEAEFEMAALKDLLSRKW